MLGKRTRMLSFRILVSVLVIIPLMGFFLVQVSGFRDGVRVAFAEEKEGQSGLDKSGGQGNPNSAGKAGEAAEENKEKAPVPGAPPGTKTPRKKPGMVARREFAFGLTLFDGSQYQGTFCPAEIPTIYMVADVNNVITAHETDVYFWPITKEYMADWMGTNIRKEGVLEILRKDEVITTIPLQSYVLRYPQGYLGNATDLLFGKEAEDVSKEYKAKVEAYYKDVMKYYEAMRDYDRQVNEFIKNPKAFKGQVPKEPPQPEPPKEYVTDLEKGFIVKLPEGTYKIRFKDEKGNQVKDGEKRLVVFPREQHGVGYEIIPADKWTYPVKSDDLMGNIYALGGQVVYLKAFEAEQYNRHHHEKLTALPSLVSGRGMENQEIWIHVKPLTGEKYKIQILDGTKVIREVEERPYYVKQRPGSALGYDIVEFTEKEFPGRQASFTAFKVDMPEESGRYSLRLVGEDGKSVSGSVRSLRSIRTPGFTTFLIPSLVPLVVGLGALAFRGWRVRRSAASAKAAGRSPGSLGQLL